MHDLSGVMGSAMRELLVITCYDTSVQQGRTIIVRVGHASGETSCGTAEGASHLVVTVETGSGTTLSATNIPVPIEIETVQVRRPADRASALAVEATEWKALTHLAASSHNIAGVRRTRAKRQNRTGVELVEFRKMLEAERKSGVPVSRIAKQHGVSRAYVYHIG